MNKENFKKQENDQEKNQSKEMETLLNSEMEKTEGGACVCDNGGAAQILISQQKEEHLKQL